MPPRTVTIPDEVPGHPVDVWLPRILVGLVASLVLAAMFGWLGVSEVVTSEEAGGYRLEVSHASVTRPGLATPFSMTVRRVDGADLPGIVTLSLDPDYLEMFDENGLDPTPASAHATESRLVWTFEVPEGEEELAVAFDARLEPAVQARRQPGSVSVLIDGRAVVSTDFYTVVLP